MYGRRNRADGIVCPAHAGIYQEKGMTVPDNADLGLGDAEWYDLAYPNKEEMEIPDR